LLNFDRDELSMRIGEKVGRQAGTGSSLDLRGKGNGDLAARIT
jgi:hypothetical protein